MTTKQKKILLVSLLAIISVFTLLIFFQIGYKAGLEKNRWRQSPTERRYQEKYFASELRKKGYSEVDIKLILLNFQNWGWELTTDDLPDLNAEKRIGVIKQLAYYPERLDLPEEERGFCSDLVIILRKRPEKNFFGPIVNFDRRIHSEIHNYEKEIIDFALHHEPNYSQWEIAILCLVGNQRVSGASAGAAIYLALLSALHQKPLSRNLAATGEFRQGKIFPVAALRAKITAAFRQGVNCLVLPRQHFLPINSQETDDLFWMFFGEGMNTENYQQEVSDKVKEKIEPHFVENAQDLEEFFFQTPEWKKKWEKQQQEIESWKKARKQQKYSFENEQSKNKDEDRICTCDKCGRKFNFDKEGGSFSQSIVYKPDGKEEKKNLYLCHNCM